MKRRRRHTQQLRPALAADLRELFRTMMPAAPAIRTPTSIDHIADMPRADLAAARQEWIDAAAKDPKEQERRPAVGLPRPGEQVAVFYSTRHGAGTALGDAGIPEKDIGGVHAPREPYDDGTVPTQ